jgi:hypothetical protein
MIVGRDVHIYIGTQWIYQWDGQHFKDVSPSYPGEFRQEAQEAADRVRSHYGHALAWH